MHTFGTKGRKQRNLIYIPVLSFTDVLSLSQITKIVKNVFKIFIVKNKFVNVCVSTPTTLVYFKSELFLFSIGLVLSFGFAPEYGICLWKYFFCTKNGIYFPFFPQKKPCGRQTFALFCM